MKDFKVADLAFKIDVMEGRDEAQIQLVHKADGVVAAADLITCGHTNPIGKGPAGGIEFDVRFAGKKPFEDLREALRSMLEKMDDINPL